MSALRSNDVWSRAGGEPDIQVSVPQSSGSASRSASADSGRVDTADCYEIEDLDDAGWEFINRPADPLPNGIHTHLLCDLLVGNGLVLLFTPQ